MYRSLDLIINFLERKIDEHGCEENWCRCDHRSKQIGDSYLELLQWPSYVMAALERGPLCRVEDIARSCLENGDDCNTHPSSVFRTSLTELTNPLPLQEEVGINSSLLLTNTNPPTHPPLKTQWQKTLCIAGPEGNYTQPYFTCTSQTKPGSEVERWWGDIRSTSSWLQNEREKDENREIPLLGTSFNKGLFVNDVSTD